MRRRLSGLLRRIAKRMARLAPTRHRELVRGMLAELESIEDASERARFALGAIAAIVRLALVEHAGSPVRALARRLAHGRTEAEAARSGPSVPALTSARVLGRHVAPFLVSFVSLTGLLLAGPLAPWLPRLVERGASAGAILEVVLLAVPYTVALTVPMAVFFSVAWVFTRLGADGVLAAARRESHGLRRLVAPVLMAAAAVAALTFVSNAHVVPRANAALAAELRGAPVPPSDRTMTLGELREASRTARAQTGAAGAARAAAYEVEVQKKLALAVASVFLALIGIATGTRFPGGGMGLVFGGGAVVFLGYYLLLVAGESLADRQVLSPVLAMWSGNAALLVGALLLARRPGPPDPARGAEALALNG